MEVADKQLSKYGRVTIRDQIKAQNQSRWFDPSKWSVSIGLMIAWCFSILKMLTTPTSPLVSESGHKFKPTSSQATTLCIMYIPTFINIVRRFLPVIIISKFSRKMKSEVECVCGGYICIILQCVLVPQEIWFAIKFKFCAFDVEFSFRNLRKFNWSQNWESRTGINLLASCKPVTMTSYLDVGYSDCEKDELVVLLGVKGRCQHDFH